MKATTRVILRSVAATPLRVAVVYAGVMAILAVDWRPLPEWTPDAAGYAIQFAASYLLAFWVLHGRSTRWSDGAIVAFTFITLGTMLELLLVAILRGPDPQAVANVFTWQSAMLFVVYALGVFVATWQVRGRRAKLEARI